MSKSEHRPAVVTHAFPRRLLQAGILFGILVALAQAIFLAPLLPDTLAARFQWDGTAIAASSKDTFFAIYFAVLAIEALGSLTLPLTVRRQAADIEWRILLFGLVTTTFALAIVQMVIHANLRQPPRLGGAFGFLMGAYLAFAAGWTVATIRRWLRDQADAVGSPVSA